MKTCVTCKHYQHSHRHGECKIHPAHENYVTGRVYYHSAALMRRPAANCGPSGILHEPKPDSILVRIIKWVLRIK